MKYKQKQMMKGIVLATVLGLGLNVACDISQAAGNELIQTQKILEWNPIEHYPEGSMVYFKNVIYKSVMDTGNNQPDNSLSWEVLSTNTNAPEWNPGTIYTKGERVTKGNNIYVASMNTYNDSPEKSPRTWIMLDDDISEWNPPEIYTTKLDDDIPEWNPGALYTKEEYDLLKWNPEKTYPEKSVVMHKNVTYISTMDTFNSPPDESSAWKVLGTVLPEWNPNKIYEKDESVFWDDNIYTATMDNFNSPPGESLAWEMMAEGCKVRFLNFNFVTKNKGF